MINRISAAAFAVMLSLTISCPAWASGTKAPAADQSPVNKQALFEAFDDNKDGKLSREEYYDIYRDQDTARRFFDQYDKDGNGFLSSSEFEVPGVTILKF